MKQRELFDEELAEIAGDLNRKERLALAGKFRAWLEQLEFSEIISQLSFSPKPRPFLTPLKRRHRLWN